MRSKSSFRSSITLPCHSKLSLGLSKGKTGWKSDLEVHDIPFTLSSSLLMSGHGGRSVMVDSPPTSNMSRIDNYVFHTFDIMGGCSKAL